MTRPVVIVDTNVVVAGLLTGHEASPVARILDGMLAVAFPFVVSEALLAEYRTVLVRPKLRKLHGLTVAEVEAHPDRPGPARDRAGAGRLAARTRSG